jgi:hypothetical protein
VVLGPVTFTPSRNIQMQRIYERASQVRLSAPVGQEPEIGLA